MPARDPWPPFSGGAVPDYSEGQTDFVSDSVFGAQRGPRGEAGRVNSHDTSAATPLSAVNQDPLSFCAPTAKTRNIKSKDAWVKVERCDV